MTKKQTEQQTSAENQSGLLSNVDLAVVLEEVRLERESRDQQMELLISELRQGLDKLQSEAYTRQLARDKDFSKLVNGLENAFERAEESIGERDNHNDEILTRLSDSILMDHKLIQEQTQDQEKLHEHKMQAMNRLAEERTRTTRWIAIPGVLIAFFAVFYMFYTVNVMENAMTSMSSDMQDMRGSVKKMSVTMNGMGQDTSTIATNMSAMRSDTRAIKGNLGYVAQDVGVMSRNVSPAMAGMRQMMPWAP